MTSAKRISMLADVPTLEEAGIAGQEADTPQGILVPAGTPRPAIDLLHREIARIVALPDVKEKMSAIGFEPVSATPDEFATRIRAEIPKWAKLVRDANIKPEE